MSAGGIVEFTIEDDETIASINSMCHAVVFIDSYSQYKYIYPMKTKDESTSVLKEFITHVANQKSYSLTKTSATLATLPNSSTEPTSTD